MTTEIQSLDRRVGRIYDCSMRRLLSGFKAVTCVKTISYGFGLWWAGGQNPTAADASVRVPQSFPNCIPHDTDVPSCASFSLLNCAKLKPQKYEAAGSRLVDTRVQTSNKVGSEMVGQ